MAIEWKPSELPENTFIEARVIPDVAHRKEYTSRFVKDEDGGWGEVGGYDPEFFDPDEADKRLADFKILALPPEWLDDWRVFDRNLPQFLINRRGEVRRRSSVEAGRKHSAITDHMIRRAFDNKPI